MKKVLSIIAIAAMVFSGATLGYAVDSQSVTITITLNHSKDIEVGGGANLTVNPGEADVGGAITVKNIGTGIAETITLLNVTAPPTGWTLKFQLTDANVQPTLTDPAWDDAANISKIIPHDETKYLWIKVGAPNPTALTTLDISATIQAG